MPNYIDPVWSVKQRRDRRRTDQAARALGIAIAVAAFFIAGALLNAVLPQPAGVTCEVSRSGHHCR